MNLKIKQWIDGYIGKFLIIFNVILIRGLGLILNRNHSISKQPKTILVIKMLGLGSVFMAIDSLYSLKQKYPNAKFILMCGKGVAAGIKPLLFFDEIWEHNDKNILSLFFSGVKLLVKSWKLPKLWVVDLEVYSILTTLFSAYTMAINRFGFQLNKVHFRNYLNTHNVFFNQFISVNQNYELLVKAMGVSQISTFNFIPEKTTQQTVSYIAINNTCSELGGNLRKIPDQLLKDICQHLLKNTHYHLAFTGAPSDKIAIDSFIKNHLGSEINSIKNIAGALNFSNYYSFLKYNCVAMLSIDSAPIHIALKLNLPTLSFWGPINPLQRLTETQLNNHLVYYLKTDCSPCIHLSDVLPCGGNNICMKNMEIKTVIPLLNQLIKKL